MNGTPHPRLAWCLNHPGRQCMHVGEWDSHDPKISYWSCADKAKPATDLPVRPEVKP